MASFDTCGTSEPAQSGGVSIVICTRNRADHLRRTLNAFQHLDATGLSVEVIIVDNGSTDSTRAVINATKLSYAEVHYLHEPGPGQARARNRGVAAATGDIILFTDDDVVPSATWLVEMVAPIVSGKVDAVAGQALMPTALQRKWMSSLHYAYLACGHGRMVEVNDDHAPELVGVSFAFARRVLHNVPAFDEELGPGKLGFADDTMFSYCLKAASYRVGTARCVVEHHFDAARLSRCELLAAAHKRGCSAAYIAHHWEHRTINWIGLRYAKALIVLMLLRVVCPGIWFRVEGAPEWEMLRVWTIGFYRQFLRERRRPRHYARHGYRKLVCPSSEKARPLALKPAQMSG